MSDTAVIDDAPGFSYTVVIQDDDVTVDSLNLASSDATLEVQSANVLTTSNGYRQTLGTLTGAGPVEVNGILVWSGGTMSGSGITRALGGFETTGNVTLDTRRFMLDGGDTGIFRTDDNVTGLNGAELVIESGAVLRHEDDGNFEVGGASTTPPRLVNRGTYRFTDGGNTGKAQLYWELENPGLLEATGGEDYFINDRLFAADGTDDLTGGTYRAGGTSTLRFRTDEPTTFASGSRLAAASGAQLDLGSGVSSNTAIDVVGELDVAGLFDTGDGNTTTITVETGADLQELGGEELRVDDSAGLIVKTGEAGTPDSVSVGELVVKDGGTFRPSTVVEVDGQTVVSFGGVFQSGEALVSRGLLQ